MLPLRIVYLDDEIDLCEIVQEFLTSSTVSVKTFVDPAAAIRHINATKPDLILLDYRLPNTTGADVALQLDTGIPKVLISGELEPVGNDLFVQIFSKPIDFAKLSLFVEQFTNERK